METVIEDKQQFPPLARQPRRVHTITDRFSMANTYLILDGRGSTSFTGIEDGPAPGRDKSGPYTSSQGMESHERIIVVDPSSVLNVRLLLDYLQYFLHRSITDIDLIVLTSLHPDHTGGIEYLCQVCSAPVAASILARGLVAPWKDGDGKSAGRISTHHALEISAACYERQVRMVDFWLEDVAGLPNHLDWRVIASPGLTQESLCLYNPFSYELLSGDTIITQERGSIVVRVGRNRRQLEQTLQTLRCLKVHYLYPGHGRQILARNALTSIS